LPSGKLREPEGIFLLVPNGFFLRPHPSAYPPFPL